MVVIAPFALGGPLNWVHKVALIAAVLVAAALTKTFVEDPARRSRLLATSMTRSFALALTSVLVLCGGGIAVIAHDKATLAAEARALERGLADGECVGAAALRDPGCTSVTGDSLFSSPALAKGDREAMYGDECFTGIPFDKRNTCTYGNPDGEIRVALFGNSHAGHWQPALEPVVRIATGGSTPTSSSSATPRRTRSPSRPQRSATTVWTGTSGRSTRSPRWLRPRRHE